MNDGVRSFLAGCAGFATVVLPSVATDAVMHATGVFPPVGQAMSGALFLAALGYRVVYGIAGSAVTARLAPRQPMTHAMVLGAIGFVVSAAAAVATWGAGPGYGPHWYPLALVATALPNAWVGGRLGRRG